MRLPGARDLVDLRTGARDDDPVGEVTAPAETFAGFGEGAVEFYDGLLADNSKAYWTDHRGIYENDVLAPMRALLDPVVERVRRSQRQ